MGWLVMGLLPSVIAFLCAYHIQRSRWEGKALDLVMMGVSFTWLALSLAAWGWFPDDGYSSPGTPSGLGNLAFLTQWMIVGFPAIPCVLVVLTSIWAAERWSVDHSLMLLAMSVLLGTAALVAFC